MTLWRTQPRPRSLSRLTPQWQQAAALAALVLSACSGSTALAQGAASADPGKLATPLSEEWKYTGSYFGNNPAAPVVVKDTAYFVTGSHAYAVSLANGALKWRYPADPAASIPALVLVNPTVLNDVVYLGAGDGLYALNTADGTLKWHYSANGGVATTPVAYNGAMYFISGVGRIHAVNTDAGDSIGGVWKTGTTLGVDAGGATIADAGVANGIIYYVTTNEILHAIDLSTGVQRWYGRPGTVDRTSVPTMNGESVVTANGNFLTAWRAITGQKRWSITLSSNAVVPPAVDSEGNTYVVTDTKEIYAIGPRGRGMLDSPRCRCGFYGRALPSSRPSSLSSSFAARRASSG